MAVSFPVLPTIAVACSVLGCPLTGCGLSGFGPRYSSPTPAWIGGGRLKTSSAARAMRENLFMCVNKVIPAATLA